LDESFSLVEFLTDSENFMSKSFECANV